MCLPGAKSLPSDDRHSLPSYSCSSSTEAINRRTIAHANVGTRSTRRRGLWKRIRLLRGGVDDYEQGESGSDNKVEGKDDQSDQTSSSKSNETSTISSDDGLSIPSLNDETSNQESQRREGGMFASFFSLFRAPVQSNEQPSKKKTTNATAIAHKIPHGHDGRGGGGSYTTLPPPSEDAEQQNIMEDEFLITTEITEVSMDATAAGTVELARSILTVSKAEVKPAVKTGGDSTAFVIPPPAKNPLPSIADDSKRKDAKKSKSSKSKTGMEEVKVDGNKSMNASLNDSTHNDTETTTASLNDTLHSNTTGFPSPSNASIVEEVSEMDMGYPKDFTSSGYVSFVCSFF